MFRDYRAAADWLPGTIYINDFQDSGFQEAASFEEDSDLTTATNGGKIAVENVIGWFEEKLQLKSLLNEEYPLPNSTLRIEREKAQDTLLRITIPEGKAPAVGPNGILSFDFACLEEKEVESSFSPVGFKVRLTDTNGESAEVESECFASICPALSVRLGKTDLFTQGRYGEGFELVLQNCSLGLKELIKRNPRFDPAKIHSVEFSFGENSPRKFIVDNIGFDE